MVFAVDELDQVSNTSAVAKLVIVPVDHDNQFIDIYSHIVTTEHYACVDEVNQN